MKKYWSFFRMRFLGGLQYRAAAWAGVATQFAWGFLRLLMFRAFYEADAAAFPMELGHIASYIWLQQAFLTAFAVWYFDNDIFESITNGTVAYELARPMSLYSMWFVKNLAIRVSRVSLRCLPVLAVACLLPAPYGLGLPASPKAFACFAVAMVGTLLLVVAFMMLIYIATFYTLSSLGLRIMAAAVCDLLTGALIPLPFLPEGFRKIVELTPFAAMENLPLQIYCGSLTGAAMGKAMLLQAFWLIVFIAGGALWMQRSLRRVVVQGG